MRTFKFEIFVVTATGLSGLYDAWKVTMSDNSAAHPWMLWAIILNL